MSLIEQGEAMPEMGGELRLSTVSWNTLERGGKRWKCLNFCLNFDDF